MELKLINKDNQTLDLINSRNRFVLIKAEALHGITTSINENEMPYTDGAEFVNAKALPRAISLKLNLIGDIQSAVNYITSVVKSKQVVTLKQHINERDIQIKGVATITPYTRNANACSLNINIHCSKPYWSDINDIVGIIAESLPMLYFPMAGQYFTSEGRPFGAIDTSYSKTIINDGDSTTGMKIGITLLGEVANPRISCSSGTQNGWYMQINATLQQHDYVEINTNRNEKKILINGLETYNDQPTLSLLEFVGDDWLQLETGASTFNILPESNLIHFNITYRRLYE